MSLQVKRHESNPFHLPRSKYTHKHTAAIITIKTYSVYIKSDEQSHGIYMNKLLQEIDNGLNALKSILTKETKSIDQENQINLSARKNFEVLQVEIHEQLKQAIRENTNPSQDKQIRVQSDALRVITERGIAVFVPNPFGNDMDEMSPLLLNAISSRSRSTEIFQSEISECDILSNMDINKSPSPHKIINMRQQKQQKTMKRELDSIMKTMINANVTPWMRYYPCPRSKIQDSALLGCGIIVAIILILAVLDIYLRFHVIDPNLVQDLDP